MDQAIIASATAVKAIRGQIQNLHTNWKWILMICLRCFWIMVLKLMAFENLVLLKDIFHFHIGNFTERHEVIWIKLLRLKRCLFVNIVSHKNKAISKTASNAPWSKKATQCISRCQVLCFYNLCMETISMVNIFGSSSQQANVAF